MCKLTCFGIDINFDQAEVYSHEKASKGKEVPLQAWVAQRVPGS